MAAEIQGIPEARGKSAKYIERKKTFYGQRTQRTQRTQIEVG